ncbi:LysR family glycine cleavage system transcriptional activator [Stella humosa]|uniref:LysR family glycine cleavage system transcriptional activator n=1 Tax=Stella humosa TaxID=94 RepID=A0A3N1MKT2_9PROT|nr:LysR substrate-binding domain-containing protein [Stella humosa]ROQ01606.1 LysR family glycine cleavage system transcriptional activator [Stella humosa]BBK31987.1 transcriptional regulator GcvA [Stella humosa]
MTRRLPPLGALRAFEAAARHGSFTVAAAELAVTPGAISQQVKGLEDHLRMALFERRPQSLTLTAAGRAYAPALTDALDAIAAATRRLAGPLDRTVLTVALPTLFAVGWLLPRLDRFHAAHPAIELRLRSSHREAEPGTDGVDAAIRHGRAGWGAAACTYLFNDALVPLCSPAYAPARLPPLAGHTLLVAETAADAWPAWRAAADTVDEPARTLVFGDEGLVIQAALNGLGIGLVDRRLAEEPLREGRLVAAGDAPPLMRGTAWYLVTPADRGGDGPVATLAGWLLAEADGPTL